MLNVDWNDRNGGMPPRETFWSAYSFIIIVILLIAAGGTALYFFGEELLNGRPSKGVASQAQSGISPEFYARFDIQPLPAEVAGSGSMARNLAILVREPCDWQATYNFTDDLREAGYRREAAKVFLAFTAKCNPSDVALYNAADILYGLSDLDAALKVSNDLIVMSPDLAQNHFMRAQILEDAKRYQEAIDEYDSTIGLTDDLKSLNSTVFRRLSLSYAALGQYCQAITPIQTWISIDPSENDTPRTQSIIKDYSRKGKCAESYATGSDRFPTQGKDVITAQVSVNGVTGTFVVDTGASSVSLTKSFAERAKIRLGRDHTVRLQTANGIAIAQRTSLDKVKLGKVEAEDVAAVVHADDHALGDGTDGLLGRSFLSRFDVTFGAKEWRIESKKQRD